jgi:hypothetical protein
MKKLLLLVFFSYSSLSVAQTDSMFVEKMNGTIRGYSLSFISEILFSGTPTNIKEKELEQTILSSFLLYQNYPNPFNPTTSIQYTIPSSGEVLVNIFNIQGRLIRTLFQSFQNAGNHSIVWDSRNNDGNLVSSGTYFCQVSFKNNSLVKKLLLVK